MDAANVSARPETPGFDEVVADLRLLRLEGLVRLRYVRLSALEGCAGSAGAVGPKEIEDLLRRAVDRLGGGHLGEAAAYTFGLAPGTRDWPAQDRRRRAAQAYGVSVERFRKHQELVVFEQVAEQVLAADASSAADVAADSGSRDANDADRPAAPRPETTPIQLGVSIELSFVAGASVVPVTVHVTSVDLLTDIDVLVSPANVYLEVAKFYSATVAGRLRAAAARRDAAGRVIDDVVQRELHDWQEANGGQGVALTPGTVVPTSPGALAESGVRRLYHVAAAVPWPSTNDYHVNADTVIHSVRGVFALARRERGDFEPVLSSLCFPLIGSGRGGMPVVESIEALWWALRQDLVRDPAWRIHLTVHRSDLATPLVAHLLAAGAREA